MPRHEEPPLRKRRPQKGVRPKPGQKRKRHPVVPPINIRMASSRRRSMPASVALVAALFFIFVAMYMVRAVHSALTPDVAVEIVRMGNREVQRSVTGMIVRYEEVIFAPRDGQVIWAVANTDRVRRDVLVAGIADNVEAAARMNRDRRALEEEMKRLNERRHYSEADPAVQRINNTLRNAMNSNMYNLSALNLAEINTLRNNLDSLTDTRIRMIVAASHGAVGADISRQHDQLTAQYGMNSTNIYAPRSGIMFNIVDMHENVVTPDNVTELSRQDVNVIVDHATLFPARDVEAGDPVFKIVGNTWYIVAYMPNSMIEGFAEDTDRVVFVQNAITGNYEPMTMRVVHIEQFHLESRVVFRSSRNVMDFLNQRNVSIRTTDYISRGLQVSTSAIAIRRFVRIPVTHVFDRGGYYVHIHDDYGLIQVPIEVSERTDDDVYVLEETLDLAIGDVLIPASLYGDSFTITESAVRVEYGVFRTTFGYANFTPITLDGELSELDAYTLLDPSRNHNLRQFDPIVTDASTVIQGQIIR